MNNYKISINTKNKFFKFLKEENNTTIQNMSVDVDIMIEQVSAILNFDFKIQKQILVSLRYFIEEANYNIINILIQKQIHLILLKLFYNDDITLIIKLLKVIKIWISKFPKSSPFINDDFIISLFHLAINVDENDKLRILSFKVLIIMLINFPNINVLFNDVDYFNDIIAIYLYENNTIFQQNILDLIFCLLNGDFKYDLDVINNVCDLFENFHLEINDIHFDDLCDIALVFCFLGINYSFRFCMNVNLSFLFSSISKCDSTSQIKLLNFLAFFLSTNNTELINYSLYNFSWNWFLPIFKDENSSAIKKLLKVIVLIIKEKPEFIQLEDNEMIINYLCIYLNSEKTKFNIKETILNAVEPLFLNENYLIIEKFLNNGFLEISSLFLESSNSKLCISLILIFHKIFSIYCDNDIIINKMIDLGIFDSISNLVSSENESVSLNAKRFHEVINKNLKKY